VTGPLIGVVADDLTGACDVAEAIAQSGLSTAVRLGVPGRDEQVDADCVVVALKSRTIAPSDAVAMSVASATWLRDLGVEWLYQKYCSTFDSTDRGNIGPVADALADVVAADGNRAEGGYLSVGTPATPAVGRTQYLGHLFVGRKLLAESPLRNHPLTPMTDSNLVRLFGRQSAHPVRLVDLGAVHEGVPAVQEEIAVLSRTEPAHILVDAVTDDDLNIVASAITGLPGPGIRLAGGAAGLGGALARALAARNGAAPDASPAEPLPAVPAGRRLIVSGSASATSRAQAAAFDGPVVWFDPVGVANDVQQTDELCSALAAALDTADDSPVLLAPVGAADVDSSERLRAVQAELGTEESAGVVEGTLSRLASTAVADLGVSSIIVAGGETSGAVAEALGVRWLRLGRSAARGVPWMVAETRFGTVSLLLKSGNFGHTDLFRSAWQVAP
jgi:uncharacterized protein YgbK (DUF1537 family)